MAFDGLFMFMWQFLFSLLSILTSYFSPLELIRILNFLFNFSQLTPTCFVVQPSRTSMDQKNSNSNLKDNWSQYIHDFTDNIELDRTKKIVENCVFDRSLAHSLDIQHQSQLFTYTSPNHIGTENYQLLIQQMIQEEDGKKNNVQKNQSFQICATKQKRKPRKSLKTKRSTKKKKEPKQHIYSKNYRQKKKNEFKVLQEQNIFLKAKIQQLQTRLNDIQKQLNHLKFDRLQQKNPLSEHHIHWLQKIKQLHPKLHEDENLYRQFAVSYDTHGFAGKTKLQKLQYYMNEFFENVLKDSQKYMALTVINEVGLLGQNPDFDYPQINNALFQIMQYDRCKLQVVRKFLSPFLKPSMQRIRNACHVLYENFQNVFREIYTIHDYLKQSRDKDFLTIKQRLEMGVWFQRSKYSKQLRKLREDWMDLIKQDPQSELAMRKTSHSQR